MSKLRHPAIDEDVEDPICIMCFESVERRGDLWVHCIQPHGANSHEPVVGVEFEHPSHEEEFHGGNGFDF